MGKEKDKENPVIYEDPEMGRMQYASKSEFTRAVEHRKMCCNCRHCQHAYYWRFDDNDDIEECHVVMEVCQCRRHSPVGNGFPTVRADDWCGEFDRRDDCF